MNLLGIEAIFFDLDDTLVVEKAAAEAAFLAACEHAEAKYGIPPQSLHEAVRRRARELWHASPTHGYCRQIGISSWEGMWGRFLGDGPDLQQLAQWIPTYRRDAWATALKDFEILDKSLAETLASVFQKERRLRHMRFPDVDGCLDALRGKFRMSIITNGASDLQREKIRGTRLESCFDPIIVAGDVGIAKPDIRIFNHVLQQVGVEPGKVVMVGDNLERDILGARQVGIRGIWLNRAGEEIQSDVVPDDEISSLRELPNRLGCS
ncbi:MAG: HAD family hydrolase [bacterium]